MVARCIVSKRANANINNALLMMTEAITTALSNPASDGAAENQICEDLVCALKDTSSNVALDAQSGISASQTNDLTDNGSQVIEVVAIESDKVGKHSHHHTTIATLCEHHAAHAVHDCNCHWWDRLSAFDWLHMMTEIMVHIILHAVLVFAFRKGKKAVKKSNKLNSDTRSDHGDACSHASGVSTKVRPIRSGSESHHSHAEHV